MAEHCPGCDGDHLPMPDDDADQGRIALAAADARERQYRWHLERIQGFCEQLNRTGAAMPAEVCGQEAVDALRVVPGSDEGLRALCLQVAEKILGRPFSWPSNWREALRDRKGGNPDEWPADLQVREWPSP